MNDDKHRCTRATCTDFETHHAERVKARNKRARKASRVRDSIMTDLGMTKVRGSVSGRTYWE